MPTPVPTTAQNYEEGGENTIDNGDAGGEINLQEFGPGAPLMGERDIPMETQVRLCDNYSSCHGFV